MCPHGDSNSGLNLERVASWSSRRWGLVLSWGILSSTPVSVKHLLLFVLLDALVEQSDYVGVVAVEQHAGALHAQVGDQDGG